MSAPKPWRSTSPSQLATFSDCRRKWWRVSVNGERPPSTAAAERGSKIHAELEAYLMHGAPLSDGTARAMSPFLPAAGSVPAHAVEVAFEWAPPGWPVPVRGRVDLVELDGAGAVVGITDHKTTASLNYAKSVQDLARDPQALLYSGAAFSGALDGVPAADEGAPLRFRLLYGTTRAPVSTREVSASFSASGVSHALERLGERASAQAATSEAAAWLDVEPSYSACDKYGGCPFLSDCRAAARPLPVYEASKVSSVDDWFASLAPAQTQAAAPAPLPSPSAPAPAVAPEAPATSAPGALSSEPSPSPEDEEREVREAVAFIFGPSEPAPVSSEPAPAPFEPAPSEPAPAPAVYAVNPPDGLPDGEEPPREERKRRAPRVSVGGEHRAASSLKVGELREALASAVAALSEPLRLAYEERAAARELKTTKAGLLERLELVEGLKSGAVLPSDHVEGAGGFDLFSAPVSSSPSEPVASAPVPVSSEPVASEPVTSEPAPVSSPSEPVASEPVALARVLLIDAHAAGAVEGEAVLAPLIAELSRAHGSPLALMDYARGWVLLGFEIERRGWSAVFGGASVVRFDSGSPIYRHASFSLMSQASLVVRGSR